jgi:hypothetical protein
MAQRFFFFTRIRGECAGSPMAGASFAFYRPEGKGRLLPRAAGLASIWTHMLRLTSARRVAWRVRYEVVTCTRRMVAMLLAKARGWRSRPYEPAPAARKPVEALTQEQAPESSRDAVGTRASWRTGSWCRLVRPLPPASLFGQQHCAHTTTLSGAVSAFATAEAHAPPHIVLQVFKAVHTQWIRAHGTGIPCRQTSHGDVAQASCQGLVPVRVCLQGSLWRCTDNAGS